MLNRSIINGICHGVLVLALSQAAIIPARAGGPDPSRPQSMTFQETVLSTRKGSLDVEWKITKITSTLSRSPNLYKITILSPANRPNVSLLINDKPAIHIASHVQTFDFDFSNYGEGELKVTLMVFDDKKAGATTRTVDVVSVPGVAVPQKKIL